MNSFTGKKLEMTCLHCGKKFLARDQAKYCSSRCRQAAYRIRLVRAVPSKRTG